MSNSFGFGGTNAALIFEKVKSWVWWRVKKD
jgi:acyl transferase domain-containing protein